MFVWGLNSFGAGAKVLQENFVNITAADVLATYIAMPSLVMLLTTHDKVVLVFLEVIFQLQVLF